jgi:hypothetical protein
VNRERGQRYERAAVQRRLKQAVELPKPRT